MAVKQALLYCKNTNGTARVPSLMKRRPVDEPDAPLPLKRARLVERLEEGVGADEWTVVARHFSVATRLSLASTCRALRQQLFVRTNHEQLLWAAVDEDQSPALYLWLRRQPPQEATGESKPLPIVFCARLMYVHPVSRLSIMRDCDRAKRIIPALTPEAFALLLRDDLKCTLGALLHWLRPDVADIVAVLVDCMHLLDDHLFNILFQAMQGDVNFGHYVSIAIKYMTHDHELRFNVCDCLSRVIVPAMATHLVERRDTLEGDWFLSDVKGAVALLKALLTRGGPPRCATCATHLEKQIVPVLALMDDDLYDYMVEAAQESKGEWKGDAWWATFRKIDDLYDSL
jgi:hypothetical protein